jgi:hypothetical protein
MMPRFPDGTPSKPTHKAGKHSALTPQKTRKDYPKNMTRIASGLLLFRGKEQISVDAPKPYFERIPVETVKKIAQQFPAKNKPGDENPSIETPAGEGERPQRASGFAFHNGILESGCFKRNRS